MENTLKFLPNRAKIRKVGSPTLDWELMQGSTNSEISYTVFYKIIDTLEEIEEKSTQLFEIGIDTFEFESLYLDIIEILMLKLFSVESLNLIHFYIYGIPYTTDNEPNIETFPELNTKEDLWNRVQQLELSKKNNE